MTRARPSAGQRLATTGSSRPLRPRAIPASANPFAAANAERLWAIRVSLWVCDARLAAINEIRIKIQIVSNTANPPSRSRRGDVRKRCKTRQTAHPVDPGQLQRTLCLHEKKDARNENASSAGSTRPVASKPRATKHQTFSVFKAVLGLVNGDEVMTRPSALCGDQGGPCVASSWPEVVADAGH